jgi:hypothetical protein
MVEGIGPEASKRCDQRLAFLVACIFNPHGRLLFLVSGYGSPAWRTAKPG